MISQCSSVHALMNIPIPYVLTTFINKRIPACIYKQQPCSQILFCGGTNQGPKEC